MPYSSMSPTVLAKEGKVRMVLGSPGSSRIISTVSQVIQLWVDTTMGIRRAVSAPRIHATPARKRLYFETSDIPRDSAVFLENGYMIKDAPMDLIHAGLNPYFGGVHALAGEGGSWCGAADPRRDGAVQCVRP